MKSLSTWIWMILILAVSTTITKNLIFNPRPVTARAQNPDPLKKLTHSWTHQIPSSSAPLSLSHQEEALLGLLDEVIESKNDNDPRIDSEFRDLTDSFKSRLRAKYHSIQLEKRNARGIIVFILGRNITHETDLNFLESVLNEKPCFSLKDCSQNRASLATSQESSLPDLSQNITLAYPQIMALVGVKRFLALHPDSESAIRIISRVQSSSDPLFKRIVVSKTY